MTANARGITCRYPRQTLHDGDSLPVLLVVLLARSLALSSLLLVPIFVRLTMIAVAVFERQVDSTNDATQKPNSNQNGLTPSTLHTDGK